MHHRFLSCLPALLLVPAASACDSCAIALATGEGHPGFFASVNEQFTHLGTLRVDGDKVPNELGQFLDSSITQLNFGYSDGINLTWQATVPYVHRSFRRPEGDAIDRGTESGLGDIVLAAHYVWARRMTVNDSWHAGAFAGIKLPTGSPHRIAEELNEDEEGDGPPSGVHGHDLTLGSGSVDAVLGIDGSWVHGRAFVNGSAQYSIRSTGKYDYRFANELLWSASAGWYPVLTHQRTIALSAVLSGENKPRDTFAGERAEDTGLRAVYLGPRVSTSGTDQWSANVELAWPISQQNTALQAVADFRWRVGATWRF